MNFIWIFEALFTMYIFSELSIDGETKTEESTRGQGGPTASRAESGPETEESQEGTVARPLKLFFIFKVFSN